MLSMHVCATRKRAGAKEIAMTSCTWTPFALNLADFALSPVTAGSHIAGHMSSSRLENIGICCQWLLVGFRVANIHRRVFILVDCKLLDNTCSAKDRKVNAVQLFSNVSNFRAELLLFEIVQIYTFICACVYVCARTRYFWPLSRWLWVVHFFMCSIKK